jgi:hypothetical protein
MIFRRWSQSHSGHLRPCRRWLLWGSLSLRLRTLGGDQPNCAERQPLPFEQIHWNERTGPFFARPVSGIWRRKLTFAQQVGAVSFRPSSQTFVAQLRRPETGHVGKQTKFGPRQNKLLRAKTKKAAICSSSDATISPPYLRHSSRSGSSWNDGPFSPRPHHTPAQKNTRV